MTLNFYVKLIEHCPCFSFLSLGGASCSIIYGVYNITLQQGLQNVSIDFFISIFQFIHFILNQIWFWILDLKKTEDLDPNPNKYFLTYFLYLIILIFYVFFLQKQKFLEKSETSYLKL